jgi:hypothetical protein
MKSRSVVGLGAAAVSLLLVGLSPGEPPPLEPPSGLIAWWSFEEVSETVAAENLGSHPGTYVGSPVSEPGKLLDCKLFNGSTEWVTVPDSDDFAFGTEDFTILLWARFSSISSSSVNLPDSIFVGNDEGGGNFNKWFFGFGGARLYFHVNRPDTGSLFFPLVPFEPQVGQWYHLGVRRSGTEYTIYIDGEPVASEANTVVIPNPAAPLNIAEGEGIGRHHGNLDELMIFGRALEDGEIQTVFESTLSIPADAVWMY